MGLCVHGDYRKCVISKASERRSGNEAMGVVSHDEKKKKKKGLLTESWDEECSPVRGD